MFIVVCYDIPEDRRRNKVSRVLEAYGSRVQRSVFECDLTQEQLGRLRQRLGRFIKEEDHIRYYYLCRECLGKVQWQGKGVEKTPLLYSV